MTVRPIDPSALCVGVLTLASLSRQLSRPATSFPVVGAQPRPRRPPDQTRRRRSTRTSRLPSTPSARPLIVRPRVHLRPRQPLADHISSPTDAVPASLIGKLHSGPAAGSSPVRTTTNTVPHQQASAPGAAHATSTTEDISNAVKEGAAGLQENAKLAADKVAELGKTAYSKFWMIGRLPSSSRLADEALRRQTLSQPSTHPSLPATPRLLTPLPTVTSARSTRLPKALSPASPTRPQSSPTLKTRPPAVHLRRPSSRRSRTSRLRPSTSLTSLSTSLVSAARPLRLARPHTRTRSPPLTKALRSTCSRRRTRLPPPVATHR